MKQYLLLKKCLFLFLVLLFAFDCFSQVTQVWAKQTIGAAPSVVDAAGNVYVTGYNNQDFATVKYDTNGNELWVATYNPAPEIYSGGATAIALDAAGNVYVTG